MGRVAVSFYGDSGFCYTRGDSDANLSTMVAAVTLEVCYLPAVPS